MFLAASLATLSVLAAQTDPAASAPPPPNAASAAAEFRREALSVSMSEDGEPNYFQGDTQQPIEAADFYTRVGRTDLSENAWLRQSVRSYAPEVGWGVGILGVVAAVGVWALGEPYIPDVPANFAGLPFSDSYPLVALIAGVGGTAALVGLAIGLGAPFFMQEPPLSELKQMARVHNEKMAKRLGVSPALVDEEAQPVAQAPQGPPTASVTPRRADEFLMRDAEADNDVRVAVLSMSPEVSAQGALLEDTVTQAAGGLDGVTGLSTLALPFSREPLQSCGTEPLCLAQSAATLRAQLALGVSLLARDGDVTVTFILVDRRGRVLREDQVRAENLEAALNLAASKTQQMLRPLTK